MLFLGIVFHLMNIAVLSPAILFANPTFTCEGYAHPVDEDEACSILEFCTPTNQQTLTASLEIFCDGRKDDRNLIQSMGGLGNVIGVLMVNWLADRKGKRFCICLSIILASTFSFTMLVGILHNSLDLITASQFIIGFAYGAYATLSFFMGSRYLSDLSKFVVLIFYLCGSGTAQITIAFINEFFPGWHAYLAVYAVGFTATALLAPFLVKEDPVYLYNNSQMD
jgi:MFS family permease